MLALLSPFLLGLVWFYVPASTRYHFEETYSFQSTAEDAEIRLAIMLPTSGPYQKVEKLAVSWDGNEMRESHGSVDVIMFSGDIGADEKKVATVFYNVILRQGRVLWDAPVDDSNLKPQEGVESDSPIIIEAVSQIAESRNREDAYHIFQFSAARISSRRGEASINGSNPDARVQSALKAYQTGNGVCGHYANLMTALCRAKGIPARSVSGWNIPAYPPLWTKTSSSWQHPAVTHAWVEFHTSEGWEMADPSAVFRIPFPKGFAFGRNDGGHLCYGERSSIGAISEEMKDWAAADSKLIGGMTGPYRFMAGADENGVSVIPKAKMKVIWDGRWFNSFVLITLLIVV
jgi:hypothetical protein